MRVTNCEMQNKSDENVKVVIRKRMNTCHVVDGP